MICPAVLLSLAVAPATPPPVPVPVPFSPTETPVPAPVIAAPVPVAATSIVAVPSTTNPASVARLSRLPETVIAAPPGVRVWVLKTNSEAAFAVMVEPEMARTGRALEMVGAGAAGGVVEDPMKRAEAPVARLMAVLETVIAEPGTRVWVPKM